MMNRTNRRAGFTLIEVLLVIAILGMLAGVAIFSMGGTKDSSKINITGLLIEQACTALETYELQIGHLPTEDEGGLDALRKKPSFDDDDTAEKWRKPFITKKIRHV